MAAARKTPRSTTPAKIGAKHTGAKRKRIAVLLPRVKPLYRRTYPQHRPVS